MADQLVAADGRQLSRRVSIIGGLMLAALDVGVYLVSTLAARPMRCIAAQITTPVLDCFWNNLDASLYRLSWVYVAVSLAVPCLAAMLIAAWRDSAERGGAERGALVGGVVGLLGSGVEILLIAGIVAYGYIVATLVPGGSGCGSQPRCVDLTRIPGLFPLLLIILGTIVTGIVLFRLLGGMAAGALGGWVGRRLPRGRQALTRPAHP